MARALRVAAWVAAGLAALALVAVLVVAFLPPAREALLRAALPRIGAAIGGRVEAESLAWPAPGRLELRGVRWTSGPDTLAAADRIAASVRIGPLLRRELDVERLDVEGLTADVPAIQTALSAGGAENAGKTKASGPAGPPPIAVEALHLDARVVAASGEPPITARLAGSVELRPGRIPSLTLEEIEARDDAHGIAIGPGSLRIDPAAGIGSGEIPVQWGDRSFTVRARNDEPDRFLVEAALTPPDTSSGLRVEAALEREDGVVRTVRIDAELTAPPAGRLAALTGAEVLRSLPPEERLVADVHGAWTPEDGTGRFAVHAERFAGWDSVRADVEVGGGAWAVTGLRVFAPGLSADGNVRGEDGRLRGDVRASIDGTAWMAPFVAADARPDSLRLSVRAEAEGPPADLRGTARAEGWVAHGTTRVDSARVRVDGALNGGGDLAFDVAARTSGVWLAAAGAITARNPLRVDLAPLRVTARRDSARGPRTGRLELDPATGVRAVGVRIEGDFGSARVDAHADTAGVWTGTARFRWPVPPDVVPEAKLEPLQGEVRAQGRGAELTARVDAGATPWLDEARATLRSGEAGTFLDSLKVRGFDASVTGAASLAGDGALAGQMHVDLDRVDGLRRLAPAIPDSLALKAAADVALSGTAKSPGADVRLSAGARGEGWDVPAALGEVDVRAGGLAAIRVHAADTVRAGGLALDRLVAQARPVTEGTLFPLLVSAEAAADSGAALVVAALTPGDTLSARVDTLSLRWDERDLQSQGPFDARWEGAHAAWSVHGLDLSGTLGSLLADGEAGADSTTFRAELTLIDPPRPPGVDASAWPAPERVEASARLVARDSLTVRAAASGMEVGTLGRFDLRVSAGAGASGIAAELALEQGTTAPLTASVRVPRRIDAAAHTAEPVEGRWSARVTVADLPLPVRPSELVAVEGLAAADIATTARMSGTIDAAEREGRLAGSAELDVSFPDLPALRDQGVRLTVSMTDGLTGKVRWLRAGTPAARVTVALPGASGTTQPFAVSAGDSLRAEVSFDDWRLDDLNPLLPPGTRIGGTLASRLTAEGAPDDPRLDGWFEARDVTVATVRGNRARMKGRLRFAGRAKTPQVEGKLEVTQATLLVPEPPRELHAAEGEALLWPSDSTAAPAAAPETAEPVQALDLGIDVTIPGACRIVGRGLDVEMAGDLSLVLTRGQPRVDGTLRAVRGTFSFLGSRFDVERGVATFYGTEDIDPDLDLVLSRTKGDVKAIVHVTGRTSSPVIELSSEPPMEEADVVSYLLFGRASTDLDREQTSLLQTQASAALQMFAIPGLERELGARLGLDVLQVRPAGDTGDRMSVVVGKYLSPRALLKYNQGLDRTDDFSIDLEYWLTTHVRVETTTSRQNQSGVLLNWSVDY